MTDHVRAKVAEHINYERMAQTILEGQRALGYTDVEVIEFLKRIRDVWTAGSPHAAALIDLMLKELER